jgi:hypothetical protein
LVFTLQFCALLESFSLYLSRLGRKKAINQSQTRQDKNHKEICMKIKLTLTMLALLAGVHQTIAQGTAFTYQGQLQNNGSVASGSYDMQFILFNTNQFGFPASPILTNTAVTVNNGLFTTTLDFGNGIFIGTNYWLDISVRTNGNGAFTEQSPRQELTPTPYAVFANTASNVSGTVSAAQLSGPIANGNLPASPSFSGTVTAGAGFSGNGANLTSLNAAQLTSIGNTNMGTTGNFFVGPSGNSTMSGSYNTANGYLALSNNTSGYENTADGAKALYSDTTGFYNTAIGVVALNLNTSGNDNTANGYDALSNNRSGANNTAIGSEALGKLGYLSGAGGTNNIALGYQAGFNLSTEESSNIDIGNLGVSGDYNVIRIGSSQSQTFLAGVINGNGGGLTNLNAGQLFGGVIPTSVLPGFQGNNNALGGGSGNNFLSASQGTIGGGLDNTNSANQATVGGGYGNNASGNYATISGGYLNIASGAYSVAAGYENQALGISAVVSGGGVNIAGVSAENSDIAGGANNQVTQTGSAIGGGYFNTNTGTYATIPGGYENLATGNNSFAAGDNAQAMNNGTFVWSDGTGTLTTSTNSNSVTIRASGGYRLFSGTANTTYAYLAPGSGSWTSLSDRNAKEHFEVVNPQEVLGRVAALPVSTWNYKTQPASVRHIGPTAQDFKTAFAVGETDTGISTVDEGGVALAAIQGLNQKLQEELNRQDAENAKLKQQNDSLAERLDELEATVRQLAANK